MLGSSLTAVSSTPYGVSAHVSDTSVLYNRYKSGIPDQVPSELVPQLDPFLSLNDLVLLTHALLTLSILLEISPKPTYPLVEKSVLPTVYQLAYSPSIFGATLEALTGFFQALVSADNEIAGHIVPGLVLAFEKDKSGDSSAANISKCISAVVKGYQDMAAGIIAEFAKSIKVTDDGPRSITKLETDATALSSSLVRSRRSSMSY